MLNFYVNKINKEHLIFFDTEFDDQRLVQVAMIVFKQEKAENNVYYYTLQGSCNLFINREVDCYFTKYTGITQAFLDRYGLSEAEVADKVYYFFNELGIKLDRSSMFISHGAKQDIQVLEDAGIFIPHELMCCTYKMAQKRLKRDKHLKLYELCIEAGDYVEESHDAYCDCKASITVFQYLQNLE